VDAPDYAALRQRLEEAEKAMRCADAILGAFMEPDSGGRSAMIIDYRLVADVRQQIAALAAGGA
jgi:hypothetical protein